MKEVCTACDGVSYPRVMVGLFENGYPIDLADKLGYVQSYTRSRQYTNLPGQKERLDIPGQHPLRRNNCIFPR